MGGTLFRDAALVSAESASLTVGVSVLVEDGAITWIRPSDDEPAIDLANVEIVDAGGTTVVPGMVDAHSHITMPGGSHWIDRALDPPDQLLRTRSTTPSCCTDRACGGAATLEHRSGEIGSTAASAD